MKQIRIFSLGSLQGQPCVNTHQLADGMYRQISFTENGVLEGPAVKFSDLCTALQRLDRGTVPMVSRDLGIYITKLRPKAWVAGKIDGRYMMSVESRS